MSSLPLREGGRGRGLSKPGSGRLVLCLRHQPPPPGHLPQGEGGQGKQGFGHRSDDSGSHNPSEALYRAICFSRPIWSVIFSQAAAMASAPDWAVPWPAKTLANSSSATL